MFQFKSFFFLLLLSTFFSSCGLLLKPPAPVLAPSTDKYRLVWADDPATTITIGWDQNYGKNPVVYYGPDDFKKTWKSYPDSSKPTRTIPGYLDMNTHFAKITGLKPNSNYYFVIKDSKGASERMWFKTAPNTPQPFTLIVGGDTKSEGEALKAGRFSNRMVAKLRPLFVVFNGDFTSGNGTTPERWKRWLNDWATLTQTTDGRMFPIVPVHGNHEDGDKSVLNKLFDVPYQSDNPENIYYSLSVGGNLLHFIVLNTQIDEGGKQTSWLENDLRKHRLFTFKMAGYHKPFRPHTSRKSENYYQYEQWAGLFYQYALDISTDGDSHMSKITYPVRPSHEPGSSEAFIRDDQIGTMFIGEGSWGATPRINDDDKPWTLRSRRINQFKWLQVFPEQNGSPAHIDIRTVITSTRDANNRAVSHVEKVAALSEENVFAVPANIKLFSTPNSGTVIRYPYPMAAERKALELFGMSNVNH